MVFDSKYGFTISTKSKVIAKTNSTGDVSGQFLQSGPYYAMLVRHDRYILILFSFCY